MNRTKLIEKIYDEIDKLYQNFKEKVICEEQEDYCDEMALMYIFKKYLLSLIFLDKKESVVDEF